MVGINKQAVSFWRAVHYQKLYVKCFAQRWVVRELAYAEQTGLFEGFFEGFIVLQKVEPQ